MLRSQIQTGSDFQTSGRIIPAWIAGLAFLSANDEPGVRAGFWLLVTPQRMSVEELCGLVYSLTVIKKHPELAWYQQPLTFGVIVLETCLLLNILY